MTQTILRQLWFRDCWHALDLSVYHNLRLICQSILRDIFATEAHTILNIAGWGGLIFIMTLCVWGWFCLQHIQKEVKAAWFVHFCPDVCASQNSLVCLLHVGWLQAEFYLYFILRDRYCMLRLVKWRKRSPNPSFDWTENILFSRFDISV